MFGGTACAALVDDLRDDARQRPRRRAGLGGDRAGQRAEHDRPGFGLPPGVDDRAAAAADDLVIPHPGFRIDRLADGAEHAQARQVVSLRPMIAPLDKGANRRRRGVEDRYLVLGDDLPEAVFARMVRAPLRT